LSEKFDPRDIPDNDNSISKKYHPFL